MYSRFNLAILIFHILAISSLTLIALRIGKEAMIAWVAVLTLAANLFVIKQITIMNLNVTTSDSLAVGLLLGLNLIQEYYGKKEAKKTIGISFFISASCLLLGLFQIGYAPNSADQSHPHFVALLTPMPRMLGASLATFFIVQFFDLSLFGFLRNITAGKFFLARSLISLIISQILDTVVFSILGLYGLVDSVWDIMILSLCIKLVVIVFSAPFIALSKKIIGKHAPISI